MTWLLRRGGAGDICESGDRECPDVIRVPSLARAPGGSSKGNVRRPFYHHQGSGEGHGRDDEVLWVTIIVIEVWARCVGTTVIDDGEWNESAVWKTSNREIRCRHHR